MLKSPFPNAELVEEAVDFNLVQAVLDPATVPWLSVVGWHFRCVLVGIVLPCALIPPMLISAGMHVHGLDYDAVRQA